MSDGRRALTGTRTMWARRAVRESEEQVKADRVWDSSDRADAFREIAEIHLRDAYRLAGAILGDPTQARDAVHDAFIAGWKKWPSLRDQGRFEWWFKRIVVNTCRNRLRDGAKRCGPDIDTQIGPIAPDPAGRSDDRIVVEQALASLKPDERVVLALRYYKDLKLADIAELLDIPTGTVKSRLNKAHDRLRDAVGVPQTDEQDL